MTEPNQHRSSYETADVQGTELHSGTQGVLGSTAEVTAELAVNHATGSATRASDTNTTPLPPLPSSVPGIEQRIHSSVEIQSDDTDLGRSRGSSGASEQSANEALPSNIWSSGNTEIGTPLSDAYGGTLTQETFTNMAKRDQTLPENDGMHSLRQKLQEIRVLAISTEEKAKRMHAVMTQDYLAHYAVSGNYFEVGQADHDHAEPSIVAAQNSMLPPHDPTNPYNLQPGDLEPCFSTLPVEPSEAETDMESSMEIDRRPALGCMHYKRNVKVQCFDCHRWFPCRHCHDSSRKLPFAHRLNRKKTQNMLCMLCQTPQPAAEICVSCGEYSAWYYCPKCKLWDNDSNKRIYHCDDCGICRRGEGLGKDYVHCKRCNVCISIASAPSHPCVERATEGDCPLCLVNLFESSSAVVRLPCGHYMHGECYKDLMAVTYKCPVCSKSAFNMDVQWRKLDDEIAAQPMPEDDEDLEGLLPHIDGHTNGETAEQQQRRPRSVWVRCNDCGRKSSTLFHWLGLKCMECGSYNTSQTTPIGGGETETERILRQQGLESQQSFAGTAVLQDAGIGMHDHVERADSALGVPTSPAQNATDSRLNAPVSPSQNSTDSRASGAQSPSRRYFVQEEEARRSSFTVPRFPTPSMPNLPSLPRIPDMPNLPSVPDWNLPRVPNMPNMPNLPNLPNMPNLPNLPNMPNLELPRFSPYEMMQAVSRSLSPMRYYLEGLDVRDGKEMPSPIGPHHHRSASDPEPTHPQLSADVTATARRNASVVPASVPPPRFWERSSSAISSGSEDEGSVDGEDDEDDDISITALNDDEGSIASGSGSGSGSDSSSEESDTEMLDDEGADDGPDGNDIQLFGHR